MQQSFLTSEATADTYNQFTITFDSGWRNNNAPTNDLSLVFELINVTDGGTLASETYTLPPDSPSNATDSYRVVQTGNTLVLSYDNSLGSLVGDEVALKITTSTTRNSFDPTGWLDNIAVDAVPEPGSLALLGDDRPTTTRLKPPPSPLVANVVTDGF